MNELTAFPIYRLAELVHKREVSAREVASAFLQRLRNHDGRLRAFLHHDPDRVLREAEEIDRALSSGERAGLSLAGVPLAVKDNIVTRGIPTTCGSRILENYRPPYNATVIERIRAAGALMLGKTNCDEFAMGSSTENSAFFPTRNPWDLTRVPGGSSGGSAASVAARMAAGSLGSDTGGSIRQPAAFCGVVGLKPTYGRVSRYGLVAFASSLDQIGPITRNVRDCALMLQVIAGSDKRDSTCSQQPVQSYCDALGKGIEGLRVGVPQEWFQQGLDPEIEAPVKRAIQLLGKLGCPIQEVNLPHTEFAIATYYIIAPAEASSNLARYDGVKYGHRSIDHHDLKSMYEMTRSEGFGEEVKRRIMIGTYALSSGYYDAYYLKASKVRTLLLRDYSKAFQKVDLLVGPTTPTPPFLIGEKSGDPLQMYLSDIFTVTANLAGVPGLSLPCGFTSQGLPVGLQIQGPHFQESRLFQLAHALEQELKLEFPTTALDRQSG